MSSSKKKYEPAIAEIPVDASHSSTNSSPDIWDNPELLNEILGSKASANSSKASAVNSSKASADHASSKASADSSNASSNASSVNSSKASADTSVDDDEFDRMLNATLQQEAEKQIINPLYRVTPYDYLEQKRKYNLENNIVLSPDVSNNYVFNQHLYNPQTNATNGDWVFEKVIPKYITSFPGLYNNSEYLIRYQAYNNRYYPVIKLPKGLMLFNAVNKYDANHDIELFNLDKKGEVVNTDLRFFYPVPLACRGVAEYGNTYQYTNICVLSHDIYLMCMLSPTSQTRQSMKNPASARVIRPHKTASGNSVYENYYNIPNPATQSCATHTYDVCISPQAMHEMGLQGYITIATNDSISHGTTWHEIITALYETQPSLVAQRAVEKMMLASCMNSAEMKPHTQLEMEKLNALSKTFSHLSTENQNRVFGIPEIVLSPFNSAYFKLPTNQHFMARSVAKQAYTDPAINKQELYQLLFNYEPIDYVKVDDVAKWLTTRNAQIKRSLQSPCFYMYTPKMDDFPSKYVIDTKTPITKTHLDYIGSYEHGTSVCAFETYAYNALGATTGGRALRRRPVSYKHIKRVKHGKVTKRVSSRKRAITQKARNTKTSPIEQIYIPKYKVNVKMQVSGNGIPVVWV